MALNACVSDLASILVVTLDRFDLAQQCIGSSLANTGWPHVELLAADNGSSDERLVPYLESLAPVYLRRNKTNEGYARALNQMLLRSTGEFICVIDPDITLPQHWLRKLIEANRAIPQSGLSGYHCVLDLPPEQTICGMSVHPRDAAFGTKFFHRRLLDSIGYFYEEFTPYGNEDVEFNYRTLHSGLMNYYIGDGLRSQHVGNDCGDQTPYRKMKWDSLAKAGKILGDRTLYMEETHDYYVGPPELRDPV